MKKENLKIYLRREELQSLGKREKHIDYDVTSHIRDVNGHEIFKNNRLTSVSGK